MDEDGFNYSWSEIRNIAVKLNVKEIIPTLGNHDVNSREAGKDDVFRFARNMDTEFPFKKESESVKFWTDGYIIKEYPKLNLRVLVINSSYHHYSLQESRMGLFDDTQREKLEKELKKSDNYKHQIAVSHHHPIPHEERQGGSSDLMINGSLLIDLLVANKFSFYLHGHKHDIRLKYSTHGPDSMTIFASGSFSRYPYPSLSGVLNAFHIINMENGLIKDCSNQGFIESYFFAVGTGFQAINTLTFPHIAGFGCVISVTIIVDRFLNWIIIQKDTTEIKTFMKNWFEVLKVLPEINYLTPEQLEIFIKESRDRGVQFLLNSQSKIIEMIMYKF